MDRWLCAFLGGYALTFFFHQTASLRLLALCGLAASFCLVLGYCTRLRSFFLGALLCGILWGAGNAYLVAQKQVKSDWFGHDVRLTLQVSQVSVAQAGVWRVTAKLVNPPRGYSEPSPEQLRLYWYEPHKAGPQELPQQGQIWRMVVRLKPPQSTRNEGGMLYHRHLLVQQLQALGTIRSGERITSAVDLRQQVVNQLQRALINVPKAGVLMALLVGERNGLEAEEWSVVQRTGLAHLLAISGMHLSLVAGFAFVSAWQLLMRVTRRRRQREQRNLWQLTPWLALPLALLYAWLAGFAIATIRALLMLLVIWWHKAFACRSSPSHLLVRAATAVVLLQPLAPLSLGFWLSLGAVASILFMSWRWPRYRGRWAKLRAFWRFEWLITLLFIPVMAASFGGVATLAAVTNLVVVPMVSFWVLPLGLIGLALAVIEQVAWAQWWFQLAIGPLTEVWPTLSFLAQHPWQWLRAELLPPWPWLAAMVMMLVLPVRWHWRLLSTLALGFAYLVVGAMPDKGEFRFHVLDVEQGSAFVIERHGRAVLIDTGASWENAGSMAERVILPFLRARRLQPEVAFVTHTDRDHEGGYQVLAERFRNLRWYGGHHGAPCLAGQSGAWRGITWQVLHPRHERSRGNVSNNSSCVILFQLGQLRVLVTGDIEKSSERALLAQLMPVHADILLVPHHGSKSSSEAYFVRHVKPSLALLSRGRNSPYGHPHSSVLATYQKLRIPVLDTAQGGQISLHSDGIRWWVEQPWSASVGAWFDAETSQ